MWIALYNNNGNKNLRQCHFDIFKMLHLSKLVKNKAYRSDRMNEQRQHEENVNINSLFVCTFS